MEKWRYIISLPKHFRCQVIVPNSNKLDRLSHGADQGTLRCFVLHCAVRGLAPYAKQWQTFQTFDDERWPANFLMCRGTFVRICSRLVCQETQDTQFRWTISVEWTKRHSDIQFEWLEHPDWRCIGRNLIGIISNHLTMWFGSDLKKIGFHTVFMLFRLKINLDTIWIQSGYAKNPLWAGSLSKA